MSLVIFTAPACGACKRLKQLLVTPSPELGGIRFFEVDAERDLALTREFGIFHLPAMFLYRNGQFHCELQAEAHPERIRRAVDAALARPAQEAP